MHNKLPALKVVVKSSVVQGEVVQVGSSVVSMTTHQSGEVGLIGLFAFLSDCGNANYVTSL